MPGGARLAGIFIGSAFRGIRLGFGGRGPPLRHDLDVGGDLPFVMDQLFRLDLAIVVGIESREETVGVRLHLVHGQHPVAIAVGLAEPTGKRVVGGGPGAERLAHRADERRPGMTGDGDRDRLRSGGQ